MVVGVEEELANSVVVLGDEDGVWLAARPEEAMYLAFPRAIEESPRREWILQRLHHRVGHVFVCTECQLKGSGRSCVVNGAITGSLQPMDEGVVVLDKSGDLRVFDIIEGYVIIGLPV